MAERIVVVGGTRSGKSAVAEQLLAAARQVVYVATGPASGDAETAERAATHRSRRPPAWTTVETTELLAAVRAAPPGAGILIDALGGWLGSRMSAHGLWAPADAEVAPLGPQGRRGADALVAEAEAFWHAAAAHDGGPVVLVADEAGLGPIPADPSTRRWLDLSGEVVQRLAAAADRVLFVVAGRALDLPRVRAAPQAPPVGGDPRVRAAPQAPPVGGDLLPVRAAPQAPPVGGPSVLRAHGDTMVPPEALNFAVNVHGDGPAAHVRAAIDAALDRAERYPDDTAARTAVASRHRRGLSEVLVTAGAAEAFWLLGQALHVRRAVCVHPSFTEPEAALRAAGAPVTRVFRRPDDGWALDPAAVPQDADLVVVANPNNPTGTLDDPASVAALCRPGRVTVVDEAFVDFVPDPDAASLAGRGDLPGLVVVRSVTKLWGLAGVRAGYLLAPPGLVARCAAARQPWSVGVAGLAALQTCLSDDGYRRRVAEEVAARRADLLAGLRRLPGLRAWDSAANFVLVHVPDGCRVHAGLLTRRIAVRPSTFPGLGTDHLRITVRDPAANRRLVHALAAVIADSQPADPHPPAAPPAPGQEGIRA